MKKFLAVVTLSIFTSFANAALISISTSDGLVSAGRDNQGWWGRTNLNGNSTNDNYISREGFYRSYFSFDLSSISGVITSAVLEVRRYDTDSGATLTLFDVSTDAASLAQRGVLNSAIYEDLGTGASYGSFAAGQGSTFDLMSFGLNNQGITDINNAIGGYFSIGASASGGTFFGSSGSEPGNSGSNFIQRLVLNVEPAQVPKVSEPSALALLGLGLAGIALRRRKAK